MLRSADARRRSHQGPARPTRPGGGQAAAVGYGQGQAATVGPQSTGQAGG